MTNGELLEGFLSMVVLFDAWRVDEGELADIEAERIKDSVARAVKTRASDEELRAHVRRFFGYANARFGGATQAEALAVSAAEAPCA